MKQHDPTLRLRHMLDHAREAVAMIRMRHRLVHGYDTVDVQVLWDTVTDDLPPLIAALESILGQESEDAC